MNYDRQDALNFYSNYAAYIKELCKPLYQYFGIKFFGYVRVFYNDLRYIFESNNEDCVEKHIKTVYQSSIFRKNCLEMSSEYCITLWPEQIEENHEAMLIYKTNNIWNGINFIKTNTDSVEVWAFAGDINNKNVTMFYIEHLETLKRFITYYENKIKSLRHNDLKKYARLFKFDFSLPNTDELISENNNIDLFLSVIGEDRATPTYTKNYQKINGETYPHREDLQKSSLIKTNTLISPQIVQGELGLFSHKNNKSNLIH